MKLIYAKDYQRMSAAAARLLAAQILEKPNAVLGLATGGTPVGTYQELVCLCGEGLVSFRGVHTVNLDEYCGLSGEHPQSFRYFMNENLFSKVDVLPENTNVPDGMAKDGAAECRRYEELISRLGPVELQVLGIGNNGHIGFNGPDQVFSKGVVYTSLTGDTVRANARFFDRVEDVPTSAYSLYHRHRRYHARTPSSAAGKRTGKGGDHVQGALRAHHAGCPGQRPAAAQRSDGDRGRGCR